MEISILICNFVTVKKFQFLLSVRSQIGEVLESNRPYIMVVVTAVGERARSYKFPLKLHLISVFYKPYQTIIDIYVKFKYIKMFSKYKQC